MSRTVKNIVVVFTIVCVIFLVIFSAELILLNRDSENGERVSDLPESASPGSGNNGAGTGAAAGAANQKSDSGENGESDPADQPPLPVPAGTRIVQTMPDDTDLVFYVDESLFERTANDEEDVIDIFSFKGGIPAGLEIRFVFMPQGVSAFAEDFLEVNYGAANSSVEGEEPIRNSGLKGVFVSGIGDGMAYESWIYSFSDPEFDNMGVMFIINYQNERQRSLLHEILDSLEMVG